MRAATSGLVLLRRLAGFYSGVDRHGRESAGFCGNFLL